MKSTKEYDNKEDGECIPISNQNDIEEETKEASEEDTTYREKTSSNCVQKNHLESQILGEKGCSLSSNDESPTVNQPAYRSMIGSLLYLTGTKLDIMHAVGIVGRFQANPKESHLQAVKRIFKYLQGTQDFCLWYPKDTYITLHAYTDADWA
eukprot:PITA_14163